MATGLIHDLRIEQVPVAGLRTYHQNPRLGDVDAIRRSLETNGQYRPVVANRGTHTGRPNEVLAGNHMLMAARDAGWPDIAVCWVDVDDDHAARIVAVDNRTADLGAYDEAVLAALLIDLPDLEGTGYTEADLAALVGSMGDSGSSSTANPTLAERFLIPPFSVLDARTGWWRERKRRWLDAGVQSHEGRGDHLVYQAAAAAPDYYEKKRAAERTAGRTLSPAEFAAAYEAGDSSVDRAAGTSVFDPVLGELALRWFCPPGGEVLDPWAGGSVRGIVAALCGRPYTGIELRAEQIAANEAQREQVVLAATCDTPPVWLHGDAAAVLPTLAPASFDFVLGCPPYFDLEKYSDDPRDLSAMGDDEFRATYAAMIGGAAAALRDDRFCVLVVSAARSARTGELRDMRGLTVSAAAAAGLRLYNEAVLVSPVGSLRVRAARAFTATRVMGRTHQDVLVFAKGDRKRATAACGEVDPAEIAEALAGVEVVDDDIDGDG